MVDVLGVPLSMPENRLQAKVASGSLRQSKGTCTAVYKYGEFVRCTHASAPDLYMCKGKEVGENLRIKQVAHSVDPLPVRYQHATTLIGIFFILVPWRHLVVFQRSHDLGTQEHIFSQQALKQCILDKYCCFNEYS